VRASLDADCAQLVHDQLLVTVAQVDPVDLWADPALLLDRLSTLAEAAAGRRLATELRVAGDRRAVAHLTRERLLPPAVDVEHVLVLLENAGIRSASSGWQVLRGTRSTAERAALVIAHPELAGGVLLTEPDELERAREVLTAAEVTLPVVVASTAALDGTRPREGRLVVPGPTALHDEDAAAVELDRRDRRLADADQEIAACRGDEHAARETIARYQQFLQRWPSHVRDQVYEAVQQATAAAETAAADLIAAGRQMTEAEDTRNGAEGRVQIVRQIAEQAERAADRASELARQWAQRNGWEEQRASAQATREGAEAEEASLRAQAEHAESDIQAQVARRSEAASRRAHYADQLRIWALTPTSAGQVPEVTVDALVHAYQEAQQRLSDARPDSALLNEQRQHRADLAAATAERDGHGQDVIAQAKALLASDQGQTPEMRAAAAKRAEELQAERQRQVGAARSEFQAATEALRDRQRSLKDRATLDEEPATRQEAERLAEVLAEAVTEANTERGRREAQHKALLGQIEERIRDAKQLRGAADDLLQALRNHQQVTGRSAEAITPAEAAWPGRPEDAAAARRAAVGQMDGAGAERAGALQARTAALANVDKIAAAQKYVRLFEGGAPLLDRLTADPEEIRAAAAARLAEQLALRASTIEKDLAEIDQHRATIAQLLVGRVREVVRELRQLQNQSRLPDGLDEWTGRTYLAIRHADLPADPQQLSARVLTVVDRLTRSGGKGKSDGMALLFDALLAAVGPDGFAVGILKPHKRLRNMRVPVEEIRRFSGGQKVTAALVIFAALVRMREVNRHRELRRSESGAPLLLDNPIGKASAGTLIEVQRRVAQRCGLQLIYTTGVADLGALGQFTCVLRMDGKENLRTGAHHVTAAEKTILVEGVRLVQRLNGDGRG
jgi:hypothetical protein